MLRDWVSHARLAGGLFALVLATSLAGCYTLLNHPRATQPAAEDRTGSCLACHSDDSFDDGSTPWVEYYRSSSAPWINYYGSPWWYETRWFRHGACADCPEDESDDRTLSGRYGWGRRPVDWTGDRARELISPALPTIVAPPAPPTVAKPPEAAEEEDKPDEEKPREPRGRALRR